MYITNAVLYTYIQHSYIYITYIHIHVRCKPIGPKHHSWDVWVAFLASAFWGTWVADASVASWVVEMLRRNRGETPYRVLVPRVGSAGRCPRSTDRFLQPLMIEGLHDYDVDKCIAIHSTYICYCANLVDLIWFNLSMYLNWLVLIFVSRTISSNNSPIQKDLLYCKHTCKNIYPRARRMFNDHRIHRAPILPRSSPNENAWGRAACCSLTASPDEPRCGDVTARLIRFWPEKTYLHIYIYI